MCHPDDVRLMRDLAERKTQQQAAALAVIRADDALIDAICDPHVLDMGALLAECELTRVRLSDLVAHHEIEHSTD